MFLWGFVLLVLWKRYSVDNSVPSAGQVGSGTLSLFSPHFYIWVRFFFFLFSFWFLASLIMDGFWVLAGIWVLFNLIFLGKVGIVLLGFLSLGVLFLVLCFWFSLRYWIFIFTFLKYWMADMHIKTTVILLLLVFRLFRLSFGCIKLVSLFLTIMSRNIYSKGCTFLLLFLVICTFICLQLSFAICPFIGLCNSRLVLGFRVCESWMYSLGSIFSGLCPTVRFYAG